MIVDSILDKSNEWQAQMKMDYGDFFIPVFRLQFDAVGVYLRKAHEQLKWETLYSNCKFRINCPQMAKVQEPADLMTISV